MGIMNYCSHDPGCAIIKYDGKFEYIFAEEGFLSRKKKSYQFPLRSIKYCLDYFEITLSQLNVLTLDYMDSDRNFRTSHNYRLLIGDFIRSRLRVDSSKIKYSKSHHYAHALTAFWPSGFDEAAVLVVDGLGSRQQTHSIFHMDSTGRADLIFEQKGVGIGTLYSLLTTSLGFASGEEGKTMGLAPYGRDLAEFDEVLPILSGDFDGFLTDYSKQITRNPSPSLRFNIKPPVQKEDVYGGYYARLAFNLQKETERCLTHLASEALKVTGAKNLCFAGGVALNCVANDKLQHLNELNGKFFVQPASGDTGIPLGLAIAGLESCGVNMTSIGMGELKQKLVSPYSIDESPLFHLYDIDLKKFLFDNEIKTKPFEASAIAKKIAEEKVVALYSAGIEFGPRALGHRSFLADARNPKMKDLLNKKIKHREGYRPFAPIVLEEDFDHYFISKESHHPYMLQAPKCSDRTLQELPAICHVDGTARVQTASKNIGKVRLILEKYKEHTGVSVLVNTSFNDNDEPIVFTRLDALNAFLNCNADVLVLEEQVIDRTELIQIELIKKNLSILLKDFRKKYFLSAIEELTKIIISTSNKDLFNFLHFNARLTKAYRRERIETRLIDFLIERDKSRLLYVDKYHINQLKILSELIGWSLDDLAGKVCVIEDNYRAGDIMNSSSDNILYNFSAFSCNDISLKKDRYKTFNTFYCIEDKILKINISNNYLFDFTERSCVAEILDSYEHSLDKTIEDTFKKLSNSGD